MDYAVYLFLLTQGRLTADFLSATQSDTQEHVLHMQHNFVVNLHFCKTATVLSDFRDVFFGYRTSSLFKQNGNVCVFVSSLMCQFG